MSSEDEEDEVGLLGDRGDGSGDGSLWGVSGRRGDDGVGIKLSQVDAGVGVVGSPPGTVCGVGGAGLDFVANLSKSGCSTDRNILFRR